MAARISWLRPLLRSQSFAQKTVLTLGHLIEGDLPSRSCVAARMLSNFVALQGPIVSNIIGRGEATPIATQIVEWRNEPRQPRVGPDLFWGGSLYRYTPKVPVSLCAHQCTPGTWTVHQDPTAAIWPRDLPGLPENSSAVGHGPRSGQGSNDRR